MSEKIIIGFVGEMVSGKGTAADYLIKKYAAATHRFSTPLRDILDRIYVPEERKNLQDLSLTLRQTFGQNILAQIISMDVQKSSAAINVIDGIRRFADISYLKELPNFVLIYITAPLETRYARLTQRHENIDDGQKTLAQFIKDNEAEAEVEISAVGTSANITIDNSGNLEELHKKLDQIINNYQK